MNRLGETFRFIREGKGKSITEVAKSHLSTSQLSRFENAQSEITVSKLIKVLEEMNVEFDEFIYASRDFKKDDLTRILEQLKVAIYVRDIAKIRQLLSKELSKVQSGTRVNYHRLNAILIKLKLRDLDETVNILETDLTYLTDYLFQIENWSYYELLLFANTIDGLKHSCMMLFCKEIINRTQFYREMKRHRLAVSQILLSAYLICIERNEFVDAIFLEKTLQSLFFDETEIFERILFRYGKGFYSYQKKEDPNGILEMRKCIGLLRAVDSQNIADWYEKFLENILNK
ncbi:helix-turn-helix domain-containing protein [Streptococcus ruminantium]|uniref:helix-turn-helix domain-containing protein n=1 Tax=Streptococcus ruminantium TaxID=1917441 RepID=UPI001F28C70F|nr:Rgg/GadR/MutR family transcriptional regulator [Streptococcus ruminantium]